MADDIRVTDGFEEVELTEPRKALHQAGAGTPVVSPKATRCTAGTSRTAAIGCLSN
jgi:putative intracellular protease/amidase